MRNDSERNPLVSVVIPMYNSAKFISQTLESLLYQTMKDFEVVVVDDCSTDNSVEVVENFSERFGGRLRVIKLPQNTGTPGLPRNEGIRAARGKYIAFLDSDDLYTKTALEELSSLAEEYQADVVHTDSWFVLWNNRKKSIDTPEYTDIEYLFNPESYTVRRPGKNVPVLDKPILDSTDIAGRVSRWIDWNYNWATWLTFFRRDFWLTNQISFPPLKVTSDMFVTFSCLCLAKKFLRVPNATYIVRPRSGSVIRENDKELDTQAFFHKRVSSIKEGFAAFEGFMDKIPLFNKHLDYRYDVLNFFFERSIGYAWQFGKIFYPQNPLSELNEFVKREFSSDAALTAYLFNTVNVQRLRIKELEDANDFYRQRATVPENQPYDIDSISTEQTTLVSVIIHMYNSAKFIPYTLESLLYQTMTDFEVVVVDDCSTDNSVEVVESFSERFGGRLRVIKLPENTGTSGILLNEGIRAARGKYIAFLDSDDLFTKTALEELSTLAEEYQADVVHTDGLFALWDGKGKSIDDVAMSDMNELTNPKNFTVKYGRKKKLTAPILESDDITKRVYKWLHPPASGFWSMYLNFYRREFLIANQIFFATMAACENMPFAFETFCLAKRYLIVPNVTYILRPSPALSRDNKFFLTRLHALNYGIKEFKRILRKVPALENHPDYCYSMLNWFVVKLLLVTKNFYKRFPEFKLNDLVKQEFQADDDSSLATCLFNRANLYLCRIYEQKEENKKLQEEIAELKKSLEAAKLINTGETSNTTDRFVVAEQET